MQMLRIFASLACHSYLLALHIMTKEELIEAMAKKCECAKTVAGGCLDAILETVTNTLIKGEKVALTGFGTFSVSHRAARAGVNPQTGAKIQIPARKVPKFKAGKSLKDAVKK